MMEAWNLDDPEGRKHLPAGWAFDPTRGLVELGGDDTVEHLVGSIRNVRRLKIESVQWAVERHARQKRLGKATTLSDAEVRVLDEYVEALCEFLDELAPETKVLRGDVLNGLAWPQLPERLQMKVMRRDGGFF